MTLAPRFLVNFWAGYRVARFVRRLKAAGRGIEAQAAVFAKLMAQIAGTEFGRGHGLTAVTTYAQFRDAVPPQGYDHFKPLVERMANGEPDVLVPGRCLFFVESAGTTGESAKLLPVPEAMLAQFRRGLRDALFLYAARAGHNGVFLGRHVHVGASTAVNEANDAYCTSLDGMLTLCLTPWVEANLRSPLPAVSKLPEGAEKIAATARAMLRRDVTLVGGTPALLCALALAVREAAGPGRPRLAHLSMVWPNLECCLFTGAPLGLFGEALRASLGPTVNFHEVYAAAEGVFAAQDGGQAPGLRLLTDAGVFFEFLPLADFTEASLPNSGAKCLPLGKVKPGVDYVLLVTTPAGLCRYAPGDIVRFVSVDPPRLQFAGRTALQLNACGEHVSERDLLETLQAVCARNGWQAVNFHVAPYHRRIAAGQTINCHEWWLELGTHTIKTPTANVLGPELDAELAHRNRDYAARRASRTLDIPSVRLVVPGVFEQWAHEQHKTASASKMPRCRSDRLIADQLAALARFHQASLPPLSSEGTRSPW
ncbi:MAG TPA: GH3 auxin-responsive promoter family protein [Lacunisphaera sp.]|nr:GH3 auxin-responsive promoter family protein [Lacunisphaera sp.]